MRALKQTLATTMIVASLAACQNCQAQMDVLLDFSSGWESNLVTLASSAGIDAFSPMEVEEIESIIESEFGRVLGFDFALTFFTAPPVGAHTIIDFGATTAIDGLYGMAPGDAFNISVADVASVYTHNFDFVVDEFTGSVGREEQIMQLSIAISSTGIHELTHSMGNFHEHSYGTEGVTPDTYGDTMGVQNAHIMGTGPTGISEIGRETPRTLSPFSKLALEAAGGLDVGIHGFTGIALAPDVILLEDEYITVDAGKSFATASELSLTEMPISGFEATNVFSDITGDGDADFFSLEIDTPGYLSAQMISARFPGGFSLDGVLALYDSDFVEMIGMDGAYFDGDMYGTGPLASTDPFLVNVLLPDSGIYYLRVSGTPGDSLGDYAMLVAFAAAPVPEPGGFVILCGLIGVVSMRRRRR